MGTCFSADQSFTQLCTHFACVGTAEAIKAAADAVGPVSAASMTFRIPLLPVQVALA